MNGIKHGNDMELTKITRRMSDNISNKQALHCPEIHDTLQCDLIFKQKQWYEHNLTDYSRIGRIGRNCECMFGFIRINNGELLGLKDKLAINKNRKWIWYAWISF